MNRKVIGPDATGRDAMYYPQKQDEAYQRGAYNYLSSTAMAPRVATMSAYIREFGVKSVLDIGCGYGDLVTFLDPQVSYLGIDISETAIKEARRRYFDRTNVSFVQGDFRAWTPPEQKFDCIVWAGIGCAWTRKGKGGNYHDWIDILKKGEHCLTPGGVYIFELVTVHWPSLHSLIESQYEYLTGCDIDCLQSGESPKRSIRAYRVQEAKAFASTTSFLHEESLEKALIGYAHNMGQHVDQATNNLGFGYIYYGLVRIFRPTCVVAIGSYRGFSPICLALGLAANKKGQCYFIDPGKVDNYWHSQKSVSEINEKFGIASYWQHIKATSQEVHDGNMIPESIDVLLIDGDHSYEGVKFDFDTIGARVSKDGIILLHDSTNKGRGFTKWEVKRFLKKEVKTASSYEILTLPFSAGLTIVRKVG